MHQIGARQEAGRIGGIGSCGRELCCATWLTDFKTVTTSAARYQQLSINQAKLSGQCGRLKCCLNYELDTYMDALQDFPVNIEKIETQAGVATLQKTDIFRRTMWFAYENSTVYRALSVEKVKEFSAMNARGEKPAELHTVEEEVEKEKVPEGFSDVVGQTSLQSLERKKNTRKDHRHRRKNFPPFSSKDQKRKT
jgi:cell fate regulator YaaT (PSP1 superfamily)